MSPRPENKSVAPSVIAALLVLSALETLLAVYQWMELVVVSAGGRAICTVSEAVDCETVWSSPLASRIHDLLGVPVAALGVVWGATAFVLSIRLMLRALSGGPLESSIAALRVMGLGGVLACVTFVSGSLLARALCPTCLATYVLTLSFAFLVFRNLPTALVPEERARFSAVLWSGGLVVGFFLLVLYPGLSTPRKAGESPAPLSVTTTTDGEARAAEYLTKLPWAEKQAVADAQAAFLRSPRPDTSRFPARHRYGPADAPMRVVEFSDILCPHCKTLALGLSELKRVTPAGVLSLEARQYPLDSECNPFVQMSDRRGVRCLAAKAIICLEGASDYWTLRERLFESQSGLTPDKVIDLASSGSVPRERLLACIGSEDARRRLEQDIAYAALYKPQGTPIVLVNGREGLAVRPWLYAMTLVKADPETKVFEALPPPRM